MLIYITGGGTAPQRIKVIMPKMARIGMVIAVLLGKRSG